ncbi:MFS transporter [Acetobacterium sp. UBA5834]|uniref:MFS transporter n=1 Tax=Acetobacterium sp. UBA5834 TaxID=1945907 RepID=UPI00257AA071|nr:MFS transporter [Acetobacterium sp. UBA5834]
MNSFSISEVMDSLGVNKFTWQMFFMLGLAMVFDGYDNMIVSYTMPQIATEWGLSAVAKGSLSSWSLIGLIFGSAVAGIISDKIGRRKALMFAITVYSAMNIPIFFSNSFEMFAIFRLLAGVGLGACIPIVITTFSESTPTIKRAIFITVGMAWMVIGWILAGLIATAVVTQWGWRFCYLIGGFPLVYAIFIYFKMPESAYWLANKAYRAEAVKALQNIQRIATGKITDWNPDALVIPKKPKQVGVKALFSKKYIHVTTGIWIMYFCGCFVVYGINAWLPSLMLEKGLSLTTAYGLAIAQNVAAIVASCSTGFVAEIVGRKRNLIISFGVEAVSIIIMATINGGVGVILAACIFLGFAINYSITAVQPLLAEAYPTEFRNTGVASCHAFGRIGAASAPIITGMIIGMGQGYTISFLFYVVLPVIGLLAAMFLIQQETKGKSLDELAEMKSE